MRRRRQFSLCLLLLLTLAGGALTVETDLASRARATLSAIDGTVALPGLHRPVTVLRDRWGVAHIYAENQHDLFFAQGFVAAQDRLFQMELWKRVGQGRLAEVLGAGAVPRDIQARLLRYRGDMEPEFASYSPDTRQILESFTAGINAYIAFRGAPGGGGWPLEFQLAGFAPEPWRPEDCLSRMAAYSMTGNAESELYNALLMAHRGPENTARLLDLDPPTKMDPVYGFDYSGLAPSLLDSLIGSDRRIDFPAGSNNWSVAGKLTGSGRPLLANDPHRNLNVPSLRYVVHLVAPGWDVIGAGEPALPGVAAGHNQRIAWGFTIFAVDQQDLYVERLDSRNPRRYRTERGWAPLRVEKETIAVKGKEPVTVELKFTRHGPVIWEDAQRHRALALRWAGQEPGTAGYLGSLALNRARNWQQFLAAMERWKLPPENIVYADVEGNIGQQSTGLTPRRRKWQGLLPVPGDRGFEWRGFIPLERLPRHFNPDSGFVATANNRQIPLTYPDPIGHEWSPPYRAQRIATVFEEARASGRKLSMEDMTRLQNDVLSLPARELVRLLAAAKPSADNPAARLLLDWDGTLAADSAAAALYKVWERHVRRHVVAYFIPDALVELRPTVERWMELPVVLRALSRPRADVFGEAPEAARDRLLLDALAEAAAELAQLQGADSRKWSWGSLHTLTFRHALDAFPGAASLTGLGPVARPGDAETVNATGHKRDEFEQTSGASYRQILDVGDWDRSLAVNVPGQSGQPGSPHYSDLLPLWKDGQYFPLLYSREAVEKHTVNRLVLKPAESGP